MPTDLKFDMPTARALVATAPRMKPLGVSRGYQVPASFSIDGTEFQAGDYIVLAPSGAVMGKTGEFVESNFEPVKKRTVTKKEK